MYIFIKLIIQNAYGNNLTAYYMHYLNCGKNEGRTGSVNLKGEPIFHVNECVIDEFNRDEGNLSVSLSLTQNNPFSSSENECYIILLDRHLLRENMQWQLKKEIFIGLLVIPVC